RRCIENAPSPRTPRGTELQARGTVRGQYCEWSMVARCARLQPSPEPRNLVPGKSDRVFQRQPAGQLQHGSIFRAEHARRVLARNAMTRPRTNICLTMIVKNEVAVLPRLFRSVKDYIDYYVIVDTGS